MNDVCRYKFRGCSAHAAKNDCTHYLVPSISCIFISNKMFYIELLFCFLQDTRCYSRVTNVS